MLQPMMTLISIATDFAFSALTAKFGIPSTIPEASWGHRQKFHLQVEATTLTSEDETGLRTSALLVGFLLLVALSL